MQLRTRGTIHPAAGRVWSQERGLDLKSWEDALLNSWVGVQAAPSGRTACSREHTFLSYAVITTTWRPFLSFFLFLKSTFLAPVLEFRGRFRNPHVSHSPPSRSAELICQAWNPHLRQRAVPLVFRSSHFLEWHRGRSVPDRGNTQCFQPSDLSIHTGAGAAPGSPHAWQGLRV